jgi:hypothetical protein
VNPVVQRGTHFAWLTTRNAAKKHVPLQVMQTYILRGCVCSGGLGKQLREREWVMTILGRLLVKIKFKVVTLLLWMIQIKKWVCNFGLYCWRQSKPAQYSFAAPPLNLIL